MEMLRYAALSMFLGGFSFFIFSKLFSNNSCKLYTHRNSAVKMCHSELSMNNDQMSVQVKQ